MSRAVKANEERGMKKLVKLLLAGGPRLNKLTKCFSAIGVSILIVFGAAWPLYAQEQPGFRARVIALDETPEGYTGFHGKPRQGQIVLTTTADDRRPLILTFNVHDLSRLCFFGVPDSQLKFYTLYVETTTIPRTRVFNFNTECNFGNYKGQYIDFPVGTSAEALLYEPITFEIIMEADDDDDVNVDPDFQFQLRGKD